MFERKIRLKRIAALFLSLAIVFAMIPLTGTTPVYAADSRDIQYVDGTGRVMGTKKCEVLYNNFQTTLNNGWYASWNWETVFDSRVTIASGAEVNLILDKGTRLTLNKGIDVPGNSKLIIWGGTTNDGTLVAYSDGAHGDAAIGGSYRSGQHNSGQIIINSGTVEATSHRTGAAIGGGTDGTGNVTINGGVVRATLKDNIMTIDGLVRHNSGAAIGSGWYQGSANVTINGGIVEAVSESPAGCAIGTANKGWIDEHGKANIVINGGSVTARATAGAPAIGGLWGGGQRGKLTVNGGMVVASGNPGIGGNMDSDFTYVDGNPPTSIKSDSYSGNVTLGMTFYEENENGNVYFPAGVANNDAISGRTIIPHKAHTYQNHAAQAPSYNAGEYVNGNIEYYTCSECGQYFIKDSETYNTVEPATVLIPYFEYELDSNGKAVLKGYNGNDAEIVIPDTVPASYPDETLRVKSVETIGAQAFKENGVIRKVTAGNSLKNIEEEAFRGCPYLETADFGTGIEYLGDYAFYDCTAFSSLVIRIADQERSVRRGIGLFSGDVNLIIYGNPGTGVQTMANREKVTFYCLNNHDISTTEWIWTVTDSADGLFDAAAVFKCSDCDLRKEVVAEGTVVTPRPSCTQNGLGRYSASFTDEKGNVWTAQEDREILATGHKYKSVREYTKEATCTEDGMYDLVVKCINCDHEMGRRSNITEKALGHSLVNVSGTFILETCETPGHQSDRKCSRCGFEVEGAEISATGHSWGNWVVKTAATYDNDGEEIRTCSACGKTETRTIPKLIHVHQFTKVPENLASCVDRGNILYYKCDECGKNYIVDWGSVATGDSTIIHIAEEGGKYIPKEDGEIPVREATEDEIYHYGNHNWVTGPVTKEPTCTENGVRTDYCSICNGQGTETIPATEHVWGEKEYINEAATCKKPGYHYVIQRCIKCGESVYEDYYEVEPLNHELGDWKVTKQATETEEGEETSYCQNEGCSYYETRSIPAIRIQVEKKDPAHATCTTDGNIEYYWCSQEGGSGERYFISDESGRYTIKYDGLEYSAIEIVQADTVIPATGHSWNEGEVTTEPTCSVEGVKTYTCSACGEKRTESVEKIPHVPVEVTDTTKSSLLPDCGNPGYHWVFTRCSVCQARLSEDELVEDPPTGEHHWNEGTVTSYGIITYTCTVCKMTKTEEFDTDNVTIKGISGTFNEKIRLNYYFEIPEDLLADEDAFVTLSNTSTGERLELLIKEAQKIEGKGYKFSIPLAAKEAGDTITAKVFGGNGKSATIIAGGKDCTETGVEYSLMQYFDWLAVNGTESEKPLGAAAKDYCSSAMIYFDYNAEGVTVSDAVNTVNTDTLSGYIAGRTGTLPDGVSIRGITTMLESDNTLRLYLQFDGVDPESFTYQIDGAATELKQRSTDGSYYLALDAGVWSNKLQKTHTYTISKGANTYNITASVLTYARACAGRDTEKEKNLGKALYLYNQAAVTAFGDGK